MSQLTCQDFAKTRSSKRGDRGSLDKDGVCPRVSLLTVHQMTPDIVKPLYPGLTGPVSIDAVNTTRKQKAWIKSVMVAGRVPAGDKGNPGSNEVEQSDLVSRIPKEQSARVS
jgi:hypothetical protein